MPLDNVLFKLNFSNSFNSLRKSDIQQCVIDRIPQLFTYFIQLIQLHQFCLIFKPVRNATEMFKNIFYSFQSFASVLPQKL